MPGNMCGSMMRYALVGFWLSNDGSLRSETLVARIGRIIGRIIERIIERMIERFVLWLSLIHI